MKRSSQKRYEDSQKGRMNEQRFRHILSDSVHTTPWIKKVEHSGDHDDKNNGIDFFVYTSTGWKIPVDVKSSFRGMRKYIDSHGPKDVCIIIMDSRLGDESMREKILLFLVRWQENAIKNGVSPQCV